MAAGKQLIHDRRASLHNRPRLVPVDQFSDRRAAVSDQVRDLFDR
jgi:hypothetical protein